MIQTQSVPTPDAPVPDNDTELKGLASQRAEQSFVDCSPIDSQVFIRSVLYSGIIANYKTDLDKRLSQSFRFKETMFWVCIVLLGVVTVIWGVIIVCIAVKSTSSNVLDISQTKATISSNITLVSAAIIPFVTAFIALPHAIVTSLFDHTEDKTLKEVLGQLLDHDSKHHKGSNS